MSEVEQMTALCRQIGATQEQAPLMAGQLLKRADQLARDRGIERTAALSYLIELLMKARAGETTPSASRPPQDP